MVSKHRLNWITYADGSKVLCWLILLLALQPPLLHVRTDGFVAKLLVEAGAEVAVGEPILVTVEEEEYIAAFKDFVAESKEGKAKESTQKPESAAPAPAPAPPKKEANPPEPPVSAQAPAAAESASLTLDIPSHPSEKQLTKDATNADTQSESIAPPTYAPAWGSVVKSTSPIAKTLSASQKKYIALYGSTGQFPL